MSEWAKNVVLIQVSSEVARLTSTQTTELRLSVDQKNWEEVVDFSLINLQYTCKNKAPTLLHLPPPLHVLKLLLVLLLYIPLRRLHGNLKQNWIC